MKDEKAKGLKSVRLYKVPTLLMIQNISFNLRSKLKVSVFVSIQSCSYQIKDENGLLIDNMKYILSTRHEYKEFLSWESFYDYYVSIMRGKDE